MARGRDTAVLVAEHHGPYHPTGTADTGPAGHPDGPEEPAADPAADPAAGPVPPAYLAQIPPPEAPMDEGGVPGWGSQEVPFGLPVLAELPELAALLSDLRQVDRLIARAIDNLLWLEATGLAERATGLGLDDWLTIVGRRTGADARMLRTAARVLRRVPALHAAFDAGAVSWAQVRSVALAVHRLPGHLDEQIDAAIADALAGAGGAQPEALTRVIRWHLDVLDPSTTARDQASVEEFVALQPRLDGTGGRIFGELGAVNFALLDVALNTAVHPGDEGTDPDDHALTSAEGADAGPARTVRQAGRVRLERLIGHLDLALAASSGTTPPSTRVGPPASGPARSRAQLLVRASLASLLDRDQTPATLLTTLLGGHVRVTAATARRLIEQRGADLRTVIIEDTGAVLGVGRRTRIAPGWLTDATLALHERCTRPGCHTGARACHTDHARPWHPTHADQHPGRTDIDQLAPLCDHHNTTKETDGWTVTQRPDGTRRWHHPRTGLSTTTLPATWQLAPD